jgi:hypothetical protein
VNEHQKIVVYAAWLFGEQNVFPKDHHVSKHPSVKRVMNESEKQSVSQISFSHLHHPNCCQTLKETQKEKSPP